MNTVNTPTPHDNPQNVDRLLAFVARAQARASLYAAGMISRDAVIALVQEQDFLEPREAIAILRIVIRLQRGRTPWL